MYYSKIPFFNVFLLYKILIVMKKTVILFLFSLTTLLNAQSVYFNKRISIPGGQELSRGIFPYKSGYLIAGGFQDEYMICHMFMSQIDSTGNLKWTQDYTTEGYDYYPGLSGSFIQTNDKHYAICGIRTLGPKGYGFLIKVDSVGNKKWEKEYQMSDDNNGFYSGNITIDSGYILTGFANAGTTRYQYLLLKADLNGNQQWYKTFTDGHPSRQYSGASVIQTPDKGFCLGGCGGYMGSNNSYKGISEVIKTDSLGNQEWKKSYGDPNYSNGGGKLCLSKDSCILFTYSITTRFVIAVEDYKQPYLTKLGLDGSVKWNRKIANVQSMNATTYIQTLEDGNFILSGGYAVKDTFFKNIGWLYKIKSNSDSLWYREYAFLQGPEDVNQLMQVKQTTDLGLVGVGTVYPKIGTGEQDVWLFKTDSMGCLIPNCDVGIAEFNPNAGAQMLIYPNPFKEVFAINYSIPKESKKGVFELRDVLGSLVYATPLNTNINQLQVVASTLKAGMYVASLVVDGVVVGSQKIIKE